MRMKILLVLVLSGLIHLQGFGQKTSEAQITVYKGREKVKDKFGSFKFKDKTTKPLDQQHFSAQDIHEATGIIFNKKDTCGIRLEAKYHPGSVLLTYTLADSGYNRIRYTIPSNPDEHIFGCGEQFSYFDLKGQKVPIWSQEGGIGRGDAPVTGFMKLAGVSGNKLTTYAPIPFFITTEGKAIWVKNTCYIQFDFSKDDEITIEVWDNKLELEVFYGDSPLNLIEEFTAQTGRMPMLPNWAFGTWLGLQGGAERVNNIVDSTLSYHNPVTAIWIQDWVGKRQVGLGSRLWWWWRADTTYGDFHAFCDSMHAKGIKVLGYINSYLAEGTPMCDEALENDYVVMNDKSEPYLLPMGGFDAYFVDLTNPDAVVWLKDIIKQNMIDEGLDGWMADFSEGPPYDATFYSGEPAATFHNQYPVAWVKLNREAIQEAGKEGEIIFFNRAGFSGSTAYSTLFWEGDQMHSYGKNDGLASTVVALNSSGASGISINHSDIGGFTTIKQPILRSERKRDLFYRWTELNAFTPIFRTHEGLRPELNIQSYTDSATQALYARMGQIHHALTPYWKELNKEAADLGYPIIRHPYLVFPNDPNTINLKYQFMVGNDLMVIPVIKKNSNTTQGYLPANATWVHAFTGKEYEGGQSYTFETPYGYPAVFILKDSDNEALLSKIFAAFR